MKLVFATQNKHKVAEVQAMVNAGVQIIPLSDLGFQLELPETHFTLEENAAEKAEFIFSQLEMNCFAEDTGLEIEALNNEPGVFSARYAGEAKNAADNIQLVLEKMRGIENRKARFRTVICLILDGKKNFFEGIINGTIASKEHGKSGFGYDPIFIPEGHDQTFAELEINVKNRISHRRFAFEKMSKWLKNV